MEELNRICEELARIAKALKQLGCFFFYTRFMHRNRHDCALHRRDLRREL